jgi:hypothetical protein
VLRSRCALQWASGAHPQHPLTLSYTPPRLAPQVANEAAADGLLSDVELRETVEELRGTYSQTLAQLGVNPLAVRDVTAEESDGEDDELDGDGGDRQGRVRVWLWARGESSAGATLRA